MEKILKNILGDLVFQNAALTVQLQEANKKIAELETAKEKTNSRKPK